MPSVAEPVRVNGVRVGMVLSKPASTTGERLAVTAVVPPWVVGPPWRSTPVNVVNVPLTGVMVRVGSSPLGVQVTVKPLVLKAPPS